LTESFERERVFTSGHKGERIAWAKLDTGHPNRPGRQHRNRHYQVRGNGCFGLAAMLAEAIHCLAILATENLLLVGEKRSEKPWEPSHGMEVFFWAFVVAVLPSYWVGSVDL
jgi:hypothetical protein